MQRVTRALFGLLIAAALLPFTGAGTASALVGPPTLILPANTFPLAQVQSNPTFQWGAVPGAKAYLLQISQNSGFNPVEFQVTTVNLRYTPAYDMAQTTFHWRVLAYDAADAPGPFSAAFQFVKIQPVAPTGLSPADGATCPADLLNGIPPAPQPVHSGTRTTRPRSRGARTWARRTIASR